MAKRLLTQDERKAIRAMRIAQPRLTYREIGAKFKVTPSCIANVLNLGDTRRLVEPAKAPQSIPAITVQQPDSIIRPIPLAFLMGGNARRSRRVATA